MACNVQLSWRNEGPGGWLMSGEMTLAAASSAGNAGG